MIVASKGFWPQACSFSFFFSFKPSLFFSLVYSLVGCFFSPFLFKKKKEIVYHANVGSCCCCCCIRVVCFFFRLFTVVIFVVVLFALCLLIDRVLYYWMLNETKKKQLFCILNCILVKRLIEEKNQTFLPCEFLWRSCCLYLCVVEWLVVFNYLF